LTDSYILYVVHKIYQSRCTAKNSWWWAKRLPETCRVVIPIKLEFHPTPGSIRSSQLHKMYQSRCTAKNSWWWAERLPETCRVVIPINLNLSASVGFIHKEYVTMHGHTIVKKSWFFCFVFLFPIVYILCFCIVLCIVSPYVHSCLFPVFIQVYRPLPPGGNPIAVNQ